MLSKVEIPGIELPPLYIAENNHDVSLAKENGIPFVKWTRGKETLVRQLLRPTLEQMFPFIKWNKVLGPKKAFRTDVQIVEGEEVESDIDYTEEVLDNEAIIESQYEYDETADCLSYEEIQDDEEATEVADIAEDTREFATTVTTEASFIKKLKIQDYIGDISSQVNLDILQELSLLPKFMGDIVDCIKVNLSTNMKWTEGYNKKLGVPVGKFGSAKQLPNLIILDISGSIPRGISATMLTLIDTMREQVEADLIITADKSVYYSRDSKLPSPQTLRDYFGYGNESADFYSILREYIAGHEWGHVISFGDNDSPEYFGRDQIPELAGTVVHEVHHYHTRQYDTDTGYAKWCNDLPGINKTFDTSWCTVIDQRRY